MPWHVLAWRVLDWHVLDWNARVGRDCWSAKRHTAAALLRSDARAACIQMTNSVICNIGKHNNVL